MNEARRLIVNADDLGLSPAVNRGVFDAHERGIVTSASLMVRQPAAAAAAGGARRHPRLSLGLHADLGEWVCRGGTWVAAYEVVPPDDARAVAAEVARQLAAFRALVGREPSHLDSHQHAHRGGPLRGVLADAAHALGVPLRHECAAVTYCGRFYGQTARGEPYPEGVSVAGLLETLAGIPPGMTELACHPSDGIDFDSAYAAERVAERAALCDPRVRAALPALGIELWSFDDLRGRGNVVVSRLPHS